MYNYYEFDLKTVLDPDTVNSPTGMNYLAWQIGRDNKGKKGLWLIESVRVGFDSPTDIISGDYSAGTLLEDVQKYGYTRAVLPNLSINQLIERFTETLNYFKQQVTDGYL